MTIRIIKQTPGGKGVIRAGQIITVSDCEARLLIESGYAETLTPPKPKRERRGNH
jgi:hypothetical protein